MKSLEGQLLVASPQIGDQRFHRAVVLLLHHDDQGAMGVVLKAVDKTLDRVVALKVMYPALAACGTARHRFAREASQRCPPNPPEAPYVRP